MLFVALYYSKPQMEVWIYIWRYWDKWDFTEATFQSIIKFCSNFRRWIIYLFCCAFCLCKTWNEAGWRPSLRWADFLEAAIQFMKFTQANQMSVGKQIIESFMFKLFWLARMTLFCCDKFCAINSLLFCKPVWLLRAQCC